MLTSLRALGLKLSLDLGDVPPRDAAHSLGLRLFGDAPHFLVERLKLLFRCASWSCSTLSGPQAYWRCSSFFVDALSCDTTHQLDLINNIFSS